MEAVFPRAILACMNENREPRLFEIETVAARIWREALSLRHGLRSWGEVPRGSAIYHRTMAAACAALGCEYRPEELRTAA